MSTTWRRIAIALSVLLGLATSADAHGAVANGGELVCSVGCHGLDLKAVGNHQDWTSDESRMILLLREQVGNADTPDRSRVVRLDLVTGTISPLFDLPGDGRHLIQLAGDRVLIEIWRALPNEKSEADFVLYDGTGTVVPVAGMYKGSGRADIQRSVDRRYVAVQRTHLESDPSVPIVQVIACDVAEAVNIHPPVIEAPEGMANFCRLAGWTRDGRLLVACASAKRSHIPDMSGRRIWAYDPAARSYELLPAYPRAWAIRGAYPQIPGLYPQAPADGALWELPEERFLRRVLAPGSTTRRSEGPEPTLSLGTAQALEVCDRTGAVVKRIELDQADIDGADLMPVECSADGALVLCVAFDQMRLMRGAPYGTWLPASQRAAIIVDLAAGTAHQCSLDTLQGSVRILLPPSREMLVIGSDRGARSHRIDGIDVDGERAIELPDGSRLGHGEMVCSGPSACTRLREWQTAYDRVAITSCSVADATLPGPRVLSAFCGSCEPFTVWTVTSRDDAPRDVRWSPSGRLLTFLSGDQLCVWRAP